MNLQEYNYNLPEKLIAQTPIKKRDESKLMVVDKTTGELEHKKFKDIISYLNKDDVLVINNTKVLPSRLLGSKEVTNAHIELLLLNEQENNIWECMAKPVKRLTKGTTINFGEGLLKAKLLKIKEEGIVEVELIYEGILLEILDQLGEMPLPPYIREKLDEKDRYQTVYAKNLGSAAAPTAGLHFTKNLLKKVQDKGIKIVEITLHVGLGTFRPISHSNIEEHKMHEEFYQMDEKAANILNEAKYNGNKIYAIGTTSTRTLETIMQKYHKFVPCSGCTNIFIYPGYKFLAIDAQITNFHLPKSTLLLLVSALATKEIILNAYKEAINNNYRFFSFGDAMLIK